MLNSSGRGPIRLFALLLVVFVDVARSEAPALSLEQAAERLSAGGYVLMMRHARTVPGVGDPPNFTLGECATQRNLSDDGRRQARAIGARLLAAKVSVAQVKTSQWCRCQETARLTFGAASDWQALNSFFATPANEPAQTRELHRAAAALAPTENVAWITHQVNISAALGRFASPGEIIAAQWRSDRFQVMFTVGNE